LIPLSDSTATVEVEAPVSTVVRPTTGLVREYLVAKGVRSAQSRAKIGTDEKVAFLADFPETTRALARQAGMAIGNRGVIATATIQAVAESL
jgi:hypothetical protein